MPHATPEDTQSEVEAFELTEGIMYDLLKKIYQDHYGNNVDRNTAPFRFFNFNEMSIMPLSGMFENEFGFRVEFSFEFRENQNITVAPEEGVFI